MIRSEGRRHVLIAALLAFAALGTSSCNDSKLTTRSAAVVQDGHARFMVLSPTLIRLEYADDDHFEDGPTQTVISRTFPATTFTSTIENGVRVIRTSAMTLRYQQGSGPFTAQNLSVDFSLGSTTAHAQPGWDADSSPDNLGGWRRGLDNEPGPVALHDGLLSRAGWFLLNDTQTVLLTEAAPGFVARASRSGSYQDGYFFGYGHDYTQALADLRQLTGPAPLLPRKAFGVWFSRYWAYSDPEIRDLVGQFRAHAVPLDTLSVDTDWKLMHNAAGCAIFNVVAGARTGDPCSWNGWGWNPDAFPDPPGFLAWAHGQGLAIGLNIHPSISSNDPQFPAVQAATGGLDMDSSLPPCTLFQADPLSQCHVFDWTKTAHLDAYFALHAPFEAQGVDFWWLDWCCDGASATATGLTGDTWINSRYAERNAARGTRWPAFSRIGASFQEGKAGIGNNGAGAFAEHRYTMHFTGDTCGTWEMLAFEAQMTAAEGSIGLPYVTHDIGSFLGPPTATGCNGTLGHTAHLPDDMYVRWVQFGTFQPLQRLHSHHGDRLPWDYPGAPEQAATDILRLRERLLPYLYTLGREAYDSGLPMVRSLFLQWPELDEAYNHPSEYTLGNDMLVAAVTVAGDPATVPVWIPPGTWTDFFTGERFTGPATVSRSVPLHQYPVFMRAGAILPTQPDVATSSAGPVNGLVLNVWPGADGSLDLYDDEGQGFGYRQGAFSRTRVTSRSSATCHSLVINAAKGQFPGALASRSWQLKWVDIDLPQVVRVGGQALAGTTDTGAPGWSYDAADRTLLVRTAAKPTNAPLSIVAGASGCTG